MKKYTWALWCIVILFFIVLAGCSKKQPPPPSPPPEVSVMTAQPEDVEFFMEYTGNSQAVETIELRARVPGYLVSANFQPSQLVKKGDLLFVIEQPPYIAAVQEAKASLARGKAAYELASSTLERKQKAYQNQAVSALEISMATSDRDQAKALMESAQATLEKAQINLSYTEIRSPINGRIGRRMADPGNLVGATGNTLLATVVTDDPMYVYFVVREKDFSPDLFAALFKSAQTAGTNSIHMGIGQTGEDYPYVGKIDFIDNRVDPATGTLQMRGAFSNSTGELIPGMYVRLRLPAQKVQATLMIPEIAVSRNQMGSYILIVDSNSIVQYRPITVGFKQDHRIQVIDGLKPGERFITQGLIKAVPGSPVQVKSNASLQTQPPTNSSVK